MCKCHMCVLLDDVTNNRNTLVLIALGGIWQEMIIHIIEKSNKTIKWLMAFLHDCTCINKFIPFYWNKTCELQITFGWKDTNSSQT